METLQQTKQEIYSFLKDLQSRNWTQQNQPWLTQRPRPTRPNSEAARLGVRAGQNGKMRSLRMSDMGRILACERMFGASYANISISKKAPLNGFESGTSFHTAVEKLLPEHIQSEAKGDNMMVSIPSIGMKTNKEWTGKKTSRIWGAIDAYMPGTQSGLELKSVPMHHVLPSEVPYKALGQAAGYTWALNRSQGLRKPNNWFWLYLPHDLSTLNAQDTNTYRVLWKDAEELDTLFSQMMERAVDVAYVIDDNGFYESWDYLSCYAGEECHCNFA